MACHPGCLQGTPVASPPVTTEMTPPADRRRAAHPAAAARTARFPRHLEHTAMLPGSQRRPQWPARQREQEVEGRDHRPLRHRGAARCGLWLRKWGSGSSGGAVEALVGLSGRNTSRSGRPSLHLANRFHYGFLPTSSATAALMAYPLLDPGARRAATAPYATPIGGRQAGIGGPGGLHFGRSTSCALDRQKRPISQSWSIGERTEMPRTPPPTRHRSICAWSRHAVAPEIRQRRVRNARAAAAAD